VSDEEPGRYWPLGDGYDTGRRDGELGEHGEIEPVGGDDGTMILRPDSRPAPGETGRPPDYYRPGTMVRRPDYSPAPEPPRRPKTLISALAVAIVIILVLVIVLVVRGSSSTTASPSPTRTVTAPAAPKSGSSSVSPAVRDSSSAAATSSSPAAGTSSPPAGAAGGGSQLGPGPTFLGNPVDSDGDTDTGQDKRISGADYPDSTTQGCPTDGVVDWDSAGYSSFASTVGIADDEGNATGETATVTFYNQANSLLAVARVLVGRPVKVRFSLHDATRMQVTCSISPNDGGFSVTLGNGEFLP
jgi:hypothetical protein